MINFTAFRGGLFAKFKIQELNNGEFYALKRWGLFFYSYIDKDGFEWHNMSHAKIYGKSSNIEGAQYAIDSWISREKLKAIKATKNKTKQFIKYP